MAFAAVPTQCPFSFLFFSFANYTKDFTENYALTLFDSRISILLFINKSSVLYSYISNIAGNTCVCLLNGRVT